MNTQHRPYANEKSITVLVVGGFDSDLIALLRILSDKDWTLLWHTTRADAVETLERRPVDAVLCDRELPDGDWKDLLGSAASVANPPRVIVTARFANERLWAEVLHLGGFDVLSKPFDAGEVKRAMSLALDLGNAVEPGRKGVSAA